MLIKRYKRTFSKLKNFVVGGLVQNETVDTVQRLLNVLKTEYNSVDFNNGNFLQRRRVFSHAICCQMNLETLKSFFSSISAQNVES